MLRKGLNPFAVAVDMGPHDWKLEGPTIKLNATSASFNQPHRIQSKAEPYMNMPEVDTLVQSAHRKSEAVQVRPTT